MNLDQKGLTLIEAIIGLALISVVFVSILGLLKIGIQVVRISRARVGALALANEEMELIRNLPYEEVGTIGGIPAGNIPQNENVVLNGVNYNRRVLIQYVDDPKDGLGSEDENGITTDYKRVRVEVSWESRFSPRPVILVSDIMPKGIETNVGGGTLRIKVFNASAVPVASANVHIENNNVNPAVSVDVFTNSQGEVIFPGTPSASGYKVIVSKPGYSTAQTYDETDENPNPQPPNLTIIEGETTEASFAIDLLSTKRVETYKPSGEYNFEDLFDNENNISTTSNVVINNSRAELEKSDGGYALMGFLESVTISPESLLKWGEFSWNDQTASSTEIKYHLLYKNGNDWLFIPDEDLAGNLEGFSTSPVDLSGLATSTYSEIRLRADFSTTDASTTPFLFDWKVTWEAGRIPLANIPFHMRGEKIIGKDLDNNPIYKYSEDLTTDDSGSLVIDNLEWDSYLITVNGQTSGYDISESCPFQPVSIAPGTDNLTKLVLVPHQPNTLLVGVEDNQGNFISGANVRLYRNGFDQTKTSSLTCGQAFFSPLVSASDYTLEVTKSGYEDFSLSNIEVNGQTSIRVIMSPL